MEDQKPCPPDAFLVAKEYRRVCEHMRERYAALGMLASNYRADRIRYEAARKDMAALMERERGQKNFGTSDEIRRILSDHEPFTAVANHHTEDQT